MTRRRPRTGVGRWPALAVPLLLAASLPACSSEDDALTIYSGREEALVQPLLERFAEREGIAIRVRYGDTAELASTILEEGDASPADVFFAQDAGALGALDLEGRLRPLSGELVGAVPTEFRSDGSTWVGITGRARVVAYSTERVDPAELPSSLEGFADPAWEGRIGWAPTNGSFQSFVTAFRLLEGDDAARAWLEEIAANDPVEYVSNLTAIDGIAAGEVDVAFVNHYYLYVMRDEEGDDYPVANAVVGGADAGTLVNVAGVGVLVGADEEPAPERFVEFLLSSEAQRYFAEETHEYPLVDAVEPGDELTPLEELRPPDLDLGDLDDLQGTIALLQDVGVLP